MFTKSLIHFKICTNIQIQHSNVQRNLVCLKGLKVQQYLEQFSMADTLKCLAIFRSIKYI